MHIACARRSDEDIADKIIRNVYVRQDAMKLLISKYRQHNKAIIQEILDSYKDNKDTVKLFYDRRHEKSINLNQNTSAAIIQNMLNCEITMRKHCLSMNSKNKFELAPVMEACKNNNIAAAHYLRSHGANMNSSETGWIGIKYPTPLHYAIQNDNKKEVLLLIDNNVNLNCKALQEALHHDVRYQDISNDVQYINSCSPLDLAIDLDDYDTAKLLLEHGAKIEYHLHHAIKKRKISMIALLLEYNADISLLDNPRKIYPIENIIDHSRDSEFSKAAIQLLINAGYDVTTKVKTQANILYPECVGQTILHKVFRENSTILADFLLKQNKNLAIQKDDSGQTALHMIRLQHLVRVSLPHPNPMYPYSTYTYVLDRSSKIPLIKIFQRYGGNIDAQDNLGNTALHVAIQNNNIHATSSLLACGANSLVLNNAGARARDLTRNQEMNDLIASFVQPQPSAQENNIEIDIDALEAYCDQA